LNATGWRIGWSIGPEKLIKYGSIINNTANYCINHPGQIAFAEAFKIIDSPESSSDGKSSFI
jgi:aspartate/methionine/tyrosine aminotransferase